MMFFTRQECIFSRYRHLWMTIAGLVMSVGIWSSPASGITASPTATGFGVDDNNTSTLVPFGAQYITASGFLNNAIAGSAFNNANWVFQFVNGTTTPFIPAGDLTINLYSAWVVTNNPVADPGGTLRNRPVNGADGGGANFRGDLRAAGGQHRSRCEYDSLSSDFPRKPQWPSCHFSRG